MESWVDRSGELGRSVQDPKGECVLLKGIAIAVGSMWQCRFFAVQRECNLQVCESGPERCTTTAFIAGVFVKRTLAMGALARDLAATRGLSLVAEPHTCGLRSNR